MPIVSATEVCRELEPLDVTGCLARLESEGTAAESRIELVDALCAVRGESYCRQAQSCVFEANEEVFDRCLTLAQERADEARADAVSWGVGIGAVILVLAAYWWRRPLRRVMARAADRLRNSGAP